MISKKLFFILVIAVAGLLAFSVWLGSVVVRSKQTGPADPSAYSAVYLTTGDIYFGKLSWFPGPRLKNVWVFQRPSGSGDQFGIVQFVKSFWQPVDEVYLNSDQVIFWTRLRNDSPLVSYFENPAAWQGNAAPLTPTPQPENISPAASIEQPTEEQP